MLYFFLSYARGDDDVFVQQFYRDLCSEVRSRAGLARDEEVGFVDSHSIEVGAQWPARLVSALSTCRSFIALCSPRYFLSQPCGKEWRVFTDRMRRYEADTGEQASALMPVLWLPQPRMHPITRNIQYYADVLGDAYRREGLRQLMRLQRNHDAYIDFVSALAIRIVETAETQSMPRPRVQLEFDAIPSAFHGDPPARSASPDEPVLDGDADAVDIQDYEQPHQYVHFVVAAPARRDVISIRTNVAFYGEHPQDWAPYRPALPEPLGDYARSIAARRSFESGVVALEDLASRLDTARSKNHIVVLLVDAWITQLDALRHRLAEYNDRDETDSEPATAVMVPGSHDDAETQQHWRQLSEELRGVLYRVAGGDDVMYRSSILTHRAFDEDLQVVLEVARNRLFVKGHVYRRPSGDPPGSRPILQGP